MHLTKAAAAVVGTLGRQVLGFGIHILHHYLGAVLVRRLGAAELSNKAVEEVGPVVVGVNGQECLFVIVAPRTPVRRSLIEARPAGRLAEGVQGLNR